MIRSKLKLYSLGIAVHDKELDSAELVVYPVELLPLEDVGLGEIQSLVTNKLDSFDKQASAIVDRENSLTAKWLPIYTSNRVTAPDIVKNETVLIMRYEDTDEFFWVDILNELGIRRKETALYLFGNTDEYGKDLDLNNSYWYRISSHGKKIQLHTSDNDGELCTYDVTIDTKEGFFEILDGRGNFIKLDSSLDSLFVNINKDIKVTNGRDIIIENGRDITIINGNDLSLKNGNNITIENTKDINIVNGGSTSLKNTGDLLLETTGQSSIKSTGPVSIESVASVDVSAPVVNVIGTASISLTAPAVNILAAAISIAGSASGSPAMSMTGTSVSIGTESANVIAIISELITAVLALQIEHDGPKSITGDTAIVLAAIKTKIDTLT